MVPPPLRRFLPYLRPHARLLLLTVVAAVVSLAAATTIPLVIKAVIDGPVAHRQPGELVPFALALLALGTIEAAANFVRRNYSVLASLRMETDLRNDFYAHLQGLQIAFHDDWQSGQLLSRAVADIQTVRRFVGFGVVFAGFFGAQWVIVLAILLKLDWRLALVSAAVVLPLAVISNMFFRRYARIARRIQDQQGDMTTVVEEMATGVRIIKAFGRNGLLRERFQREAANLRDTNMSGVRLRSSTWTGFNLLINTDLCMVLLIGGFAVATGTLTIGGLVAFMTYLFMLIWPLDALGWILAMGEEAVTASTRLAEVFDSPPQVTDPPHPRRLTRMRGAIRLEGVGFRYPEGGGWVLRGLDLEVAPGETVALVGATGSGKTTLAALVPRLYDVTEGRITVDGLDVRELSLRELRGQIGMAFEDPILFSASVHENLVMGRPITSDADLRQALRVARADFVWDLPWGLETRVGEQGYSLSGGQRQRLALARAVLGAPRVLVLDDPLSAVDVHTEQEIEEALASVMRDVTALLVVHRACALAVDVHTEQEIEEALASVMRDVTALLVVHRPSTLALADRVALLEDGRVTAIGTHSELLHGSERYRSLLAEQAEEVA